MMPVKQSVTRPTEGGAEPGSVQWRRWTRGSASAGMERNPGITAAQAPRANTGVKMFEPKSSKTPRIDL
jgi:hypothetical protein